MRRNRAIDGCAPQQAMRVLCSMSVVTMNIGDVSARPNKSSFGNFMPGFAGLPAALIAGLGAWMLLPGYAITPAQSEPARAVLAAGTGQASDAASAEIASDPATMEAVTPGPPAPLDGMKISSQSWRRGGLGSNALFRFTLRNSNDYPVKDIEISCAFARRDGSHLTDRRLTIHDVINGNSQKTFPRTHVGFVNINAARARCSLAAASHI